MEKTKRLDWCIVQLGDEGNWWLEETSNNIHWDMDGTGIIDPKQMSFINDLMEPLREYGLETDLVDAAFFTFRIDDIVRDAKTKEERVKLLRTKQSLTESTESLFALPDVIDDDKSPYADFIDHILEMRVSMLNDQLEFTQPLQIEEVEEVIRESQNGDYFEGQLSHYFNEITAILEFLPHGFELDSVEEDMDEEEDFSDVIGDIDEDDTSMEKDETMRWDEDEEEGAEEEEAWEEEVEASSKKQKRGRSSKKK